MRIVGMLVLTCLWTGCKAKNDADAAAPDPNAQKLQEELLQRRDALINARKQLVQDKSSLEKSIADGQAKGEDVSALSKQLEELKQKIDSNGDQTTKLLQEEQSRPAAPAPGDSGGANAEVARQLATLAQLEDAARAREREASSALAEAHKFAEQWKDSCNTGGSVIVQQVPAAPAKGTFTKTDVQGMLTRARTAMGKKGLRGDDLGAAGTLEAEANKAMNDGDWGRAYGAASQLAAQVNQLKVDKGFIQNKFLRLKAYVAAHSESSAQAAGALQDITQKYGDGDYGGANKRINELWATLGH